MGNSSNLPPNESASPSASSAGTASDRRLRRLLLVGGVVVILALAMREPLLGGGEDLVPWESDYAASVATAQETGRPMLLYFGADWCGACRQLERRVFSRQNVAERIERNYLPVKMDMTDPGPSEQSLAHNYGVSGLPTLVITDTEGGMIDSRVGVLPAGTLVDWLEETMPATDAPVAD